MYRSLLCPIEDILKIGGSLSSVDSQGREEEIKELSVEDYNGVSHRCSIQRVIVDTFDIFPNIPIGLAMNGVYGNALILSSPYQQKLYTSQSYFFMHFPILTAREYVESPVISDSAFIDSMSAHISEPLSYADRETSLNRTFTDDNSGDIILPASTENNDSLYIKDVGNLSLVWIGDVSKDDIIRYQHGYEKIGRFIRDKETFYILVGEAILHGYVLKWERRENIDKPTKTFFANISSRLIP